MGADAAGGGGEREEPVRELPRNKGVASDCRGLRFGKRVSLPRCLLDVCRHPLCWCI